MFVKKLAKFSKKFSDRSLYCLQRNREILAQKMEFYLRFLSTFKNEGNKCAVELNLKLFEY